MTGMPLGWAVLAVAAGGAVGAVLRHLLSHSSLGPLGGVLLANVAGSAALGALLATADRLPAGLVLLLGTGLCGALTTWSTVAVQTAGLARADLGRATAYLGLTLVTGLAAGAGAFALLARTGGV
jgi:CrcB protein